MPRSRVELFRESLGEALLLCGILGLVTLIVRGRSCLCERAYRQAGEHWLPLVRWELSSHDPIMDPRSPYVL